LKKRQSLSLRVVAGLVAAQAVAIVIGWAVALALGLSGVEDFARTLDELAYPRQRDLVVDSIVRDGSGLRIVPTANLRQELQRVPDLTFAVVEPDGWRMIPGSSEALFERLRGVADLHSEWVSFSSNPALPARSTGFLQPRNTPHGRLLVAIDGFRFRLDDLFLSLWFDVRWLAVYLFPGALLSAAMAWFAVRRGLAPLRDVAENARKIDILRLDQRLDDTLAPVEIAPLVEGMNDALARLESGAAQLRRFVANAAHELRTPVAILIARLDAPRDENFTADLQRDAQRIRNIVEQLLATSRLGAQATRKPEALDLVRLARDLAADAALLALQSRRRIEFEGPAAPVFVSSYPFAIASVLSNLIDNALRAEPAGGGVIVRVLDRGVIEVIDHGPGVAEQDRAAIFEPFWRKSEETRGAGLGLAIARELMEALGGEISVHDTPGGGATFLLRFARANGGQTLDADR